MSARPDGSEPNVRGPRERHARPVQTRDRVAYIAALAGGALLWIATASIAGRTEAWDAPIYWTTSYPLAIALAGLLGYFVPHRSWRWALAIFVAQPVVLAISASSFGLMPLGLVLFAVLSVPAVGVAALAARFSPHRAAEAR